MPRAIIRRNARAFNSEMPDARSEMLDATPETMSEDE
jgi:hypothetical protein